MNIKKLFNFLPLAFLMAGFVFGISVGDAQAQDENETIVPSEDRFPVRNFQAPRDRTENQGQSILINSKYAGWEEAAIGLGDNRISNQLRANWIMVDANGRFLGTVKPGKGASVKNMNIYLMHMGRLVKETGLDEDGRFEFNNVRQGSYALIGWGEKGFFAYGLNILAHNPNVAGKMQSSVSATAFQNATTINTDWIRHYAPQVNYRVYGRYETGEGRDDPPRLFGFNGLVNFAPDAKPSTSVSSRTVSKTSDGRLVGRVHQMNTLSGRPVDVRTTKVLLLENDSVVASTTSDNYGVFEFTGVPDGSYGVLAAGVDGVGLVGINVGAGGDDAIDFTMVSSETMGWLNHYASEVAYRRGLLSPRPQRPQANPGVYGGCQSCFNQPGGCNVCQGAFANSICRSRGLTFEQWQANGCACQPLAYQQYFGEGRFIAATADQIRKNVNKIDDVFEKAFYGNSSSGGYGNQGYYNQGYPSQVYPNQFYPSQGGCPSCGSAGCAGCAGGY